MIQWLKLCASIAGSTSFIPNQGTKILHATWHGQKIEKFTVLRSWAGLHAATRVALPKRKLQAVKDGHCWVEGAFFTLIYALNWP